MTTATVNKTELCKKLMGLQRKRAVLIKSRIMQANRLQAIIAGTLGYSAGLPEKQRTQLFKDSQSLINQIAKGEEVDCDYQGVVLATLTGIESFTKGQKELEKTMETIATELPVSSWIEQENQRGIGILSLGIIIGETGDLDNYANPAKVWRRLGCAPHEFNGQRKMGSTWRGGKEGKLPAAEWEAFGYSPRRRSISYLIGKGIVYQNKGEYRKRYDETKKLIQQKHPEYKPLRCDRHGMLLATKLFLKNLWVEWRRG